MLQRLKCFIGWHDEDLKNREILYAVIHRGEEKVIFTGNEFYWLCKQCGKERKAE